MTELLEVLAIAVIFVVVAHAFWQSEDGEEW